MTGDQEADLVERLRTSEFWQYIDAYLDLRVARLYTETLTEPHAIMKNRGAVEEIAHLRQLPVQVAMRHRMERREAAAAAALQEPQ